MKMFEFADIDALNCYRDVEDKVLFFFEAPWCDECESFMDEIIAIQDEITIPLYRVELDMDGGDYISRKFCIDSTPTLILFSDGKEDKRITDKNFLRELLS